MAKRYRRDKKKLQIKDQTLQWPQDTDDINRSYKSKVRQYNGHKIPTRWTEATNRRSDNTMATRYRRDKRKLQIEGQTIQVGIVWPLYCLTFDLLLLFISSVSWGHCIVWPSICTFCLSCRYLLAIVLSDLRFVVSVYLVGIVWPLYCLTFDLWLLFIL
jgi:hypothetical protein